MWSASYHVTEETSRFILSTLYELAEDQAGYFTAAQARAAGLHQVPRRPLVCLPSTHRRTRATSASAKNVSAR
jgi:hypothetical protein